MPRLNPFVSLYTYSAKSVFRFTDFNGLRMQGAAANRLRNILQVFHCKQFRARENSGVAEILIPVVDPGR